MCVCVEKILLRGVESEGEGENAMKRSVWLCVTKIRSSYRSRARVGAFSLFLFHLPTAI